MNDRNNPPHVKHQLFRPEELHGKRAAYCRGGASRNCHLSVGESFPDGSYVLTLEWTDLIQNENPNSEIGGTGYMRSESLNQETVNKIVKPEAGSPLALMRYDFAILEDSQSEFLIKAGPHQKST